MNIKNNTILITGGATGIGLSLAETFLKEGNEVIICGRRENMLNEAKSKFPKLHTRQADLSNSESRKEFVSWLTTNFKNLNILINNAGIQREFVVTQDNLAGNFDTENEIETNLTSPIHLTFLLLPHLNKQPNSAIVNISSGLGYVPMAIMPVYSATKAALNSFTLSLRHQLKDTNVKVFNVSPPIVDTDLDKGARDKRGQTDKGISAEQVAIDTIKGIETDTLEIAVGKVKILKRLVRVLPKVAFKIINKN
jgi:uncharacterized oxidoreductase